MTNKATTQFIKWFRLSAIVTISLFLATCGATDPPADETPLVVSVKDIFYNVYDEKGYVIERPAGEEATLANNIGALSGVSYTLAATGTVTNINNMKLPTIDSNTGTVTITAETTAGSYRVTATKDGETGEAMVYVTVKPETKGKLNEAIKTGIERYGNTADFNYIITSEITDMRCLFSKNHDDTNAHGDVILNCIYQANIRPYIANFDGDITRWDVSKVTTMKDMFSSATAFNQDISGWDVSQVTNMFTMFAGATDFNQDLNNWDVSQVTSMMNMFNSATAFNGNITNWNVSKVTTMYRMFSGATAFNRNISTWNVSKVTTMSYMFSGATNFNQNLNNWDVSKVTTMRNMFSGATAFNRNISTWKVSKVTDMYSMFYGASAFNGNIGGWNVSSVTDMGFMFYNASAFNQNLEAWDVANDVDKGEMFSGSSVSADAGNLPCWFDGTQAKCSSSSN